MGSLTPLITEDRAMEWPPLQAQGECEVTGIKSEPRRGRHICYLEVQVQTAPELCAGVTNHGAVAQETGGAGADIFEENKEDAG